MGGANRWSEKEFEQLEKSEQQLLHIEGIEKCPQCGGYHRKNKYNFSTENCEEAIDF